MSNYDGLPGLKAIYVPNRKLGYGPKGSYKGRGILVVGTNIPYIVLNLSNIRAKELYGKGYCARGAMELRIKEHKPYLRSERSS